MNHMKNFTKYTSCLLVGLVVASCSKQSVGNPNIPQRDYVNPTYTTDNTSVNISLPAGTTPQDIKMSTLTDEEKTAGQILVAVGKIRQFYVDIKLNTNQVLNNYYAVNWKVSNTDIGTISEKGVFTPLKEGRTKVIASIGGVATQIEVSVSSALNVWAQVPSPTSRDLYSVKLINDNEAWAVGQGGAILHYLNGTWLDDASNAPAGIADLTGVDGSDSGEVWAVGGTNLLQNTGGKWEKANYAVDGNLKAIDMVNNSEGWAVGSTSDGKALVLHYVNGNWQGVTSDIKEELNTVSAVGPNEVWVGGKSRFLGAPVLYKFSGDKWTKARFNQDNILSNLLSKVKPWDGTYEVKSVKMLNSSQGWAVGEYTPVASTIRGKRGFMFYYDSVKDIWVPATFDKATANLDQVPLKNVGMVSGGKGWVLGTNTPPKKLFQKDVSDIPGNFLESDGKNLKIDTNYQANTVGKSFYGIDILPNGNGIVVGESGFIMQHQYDVSRPNYYNSGNSYGNYSNNYANPNSNTNAGGYSGGTTGQY